MFCILVTYHFHIVWGGWFEKWLYLHLYYYNNPKSLLVAVKKSVSSWVNISILVEESLVEELIAECFEAKKYSHSIYSNFPVGAALLCKDGTIVRGKLKKTRMMFTTFESSYGW